MPCKRGARRIVVGQREQARSRFASRRATRKMCEPARPCDPAYCAHARRLRRKQTPYTAVRLDDEEAVKSIVKDTLFGLWATVNNLSRLRPSKRDRYRVTVFGSARTDQEHWVYQEVRDMCAALTALGCDIVTGGGPGLMQAANEGTRAAVDDADEAVAIIREHHARWQAARSVG